MMQKGKELVVLMYIDYIEWGNVVASSILAMWSVYRYAREPGVDSGVH